jgi:hypothetical protein
MVTRELGSSGGGEGVVAGLGEDVAGLPDDLAGLRQCSAYASAMQIIEGAGAWRSPAAAANDWVEHLKVADLSVGTYCISVGGSTTRARTPKTRSTSSRPAGRRL